MSALVMWTIYDRPTDFPEDYVARRWVIDAHGACATDRILVSKHDLQWLREQMIDMHLTVLPRSDGDAPCIVETWL